MVRGAAPAFKREEMKVAGEIDAVGAKDKARQSHLLVSMLATSGTDMKDYFWFIPTSEKQDLITIR